MSLRPHLVRDHQHAEEHPRPRDRIRAFLPPELQAIQRQRRIHPRYQFYLPEKLETTYKLDILVGNRSSPFSKLYSLSYKFMALLKKDNPDYLLDIDTNPFQILPENFPNNNFGQILLYFYENIYCSFYY
jgi:hypothetical protein